MDQHQLLISPSWLGVAALVIGTMIRLLKGDPAVSWFPPFLPARWRTLPPAWRPRVALALGVASSVVEKRAQGAPWPAAAVGGLLEGLAAGGVAIAGHEVLVESLRKGRELGESRLNYVKRMSSRPPPMALAADVGVPPAAAVPTFEGRAGDLPSIMGDPADDETKP